MNLPSISKSFFNGDCFDAYRILGAHPRQGDHGEEGWRCAVWAPGATAVEVCGGFDGWGAGIPLQKADTGVWSGFVSGLCEGELYKYPPSTGPTAAWSCGADTLRFRVRSTAPPTPAA